MSRRRFAVTGASCSWRGLAFAALVSVGLSTTAAGNDGRWEPYFFASARHSHTVVHDTHHDRMVLFGGAYFGSTYSAAGPRSDVWVLAGDGAAGWVHVAPSGTPPPARWDHTAIYDPIRRSMIVYGGRAGSVHADVWELSLDGTASWAPFGAGAPARTEHSAVYDALRHRMVVFGGRDAGGVATDQVWALDLSGSGAWSLLATSGTGPGPRAEHVATYDPVRDRMVVQGGVGESLVWFLDFAGTPTWSSESTTGTVATADHGATYDSQRDRMLVSGLFTGLDAYSFPDDTGWTELMLGAGTLGSSLTYDSVRDRVLVFGGYIPTVEENYYNEATSAVLPEGEATSQQIVAPPSVPALTGHTIIHDPVFDRLVVLSSTVLAMVPITGHPSWNPLPLGLPTTGGHVAVHDPVGARMLVFSGSQNEVWALELDATPAWSFVPTSNPPSARTRASAIYDPVRHRMILFGGFVGDLPTNEVWALALTEPASWTLLAPSGTPPSGRRDHGAIYDPAGDRMIVFGGAGSVSETNDETWALSLGESPAWSLLSADTPPPARLQAVTVHDSRRNRMIVFGGRRTHPSDPCLQDAWSLSLTGAAAWTLLAPEGGLPASRSWAGGAYDALRDRVIVNGGDLVHIPPCCSSSDRKRFNDWWQLGFGGPVVAVEDPAATARVTLAAPWPNPAFQTVDFGFRLPADATVRLSIYDLAGRSVRTLRSERLAAGEHRVRWDLCNASGERLGAGVYLCALEVDGRRATRKVAVLP